MFHSIAAVLFSHELIRNLVDKKGKPEGRCCLYAWANVIVGVVCAILSGLSIINYYSSECPGNGCDVFYWNGRDVFYWSAAVSNMVAGLMLLGWSIYGGDNTALLSLLLGMLGFVRGYCCIIQLYLCRYLVACITCRIQYLTCGTSRNQIVLVSRQSSRRLIFANVEQMRSGREFDLSLRSHGGASIVPIPPRCIGRGMGTGLINGYGPFRYVHLGLTSNVTRIKAKYDGTHVIVKVAGGEVLLNIAMDIFMCKMIKGMHIDGVQHHGHVEHHRNSWTLNNDGSLSPTEAQHLAIGDLKSSGLDPEILVDNATVIEMTGVDKNGDD